ncbi:DUF4141 domain-containing protein [Lysobacter sp. ESA13C]|uniref:DUF4141 domain-containing protein n=1 Tax=Lysobacter sp. ESA13C TaxID=2862676 RepID=UPI001CBCB4C3|nr:DUF4141 domain-containing protein [Lysobacter sp. ESA13C]
MKMNAKQAYKKNLAVGVLALGCVMAAGSVNAQWVVTDPGHMAANIGQQIKTSVERAAEFGKEMAEWKKQYDHFQQQLIKFQSFLDNPIALPTSEPWRELDKAQVVEQRCRQTGGGSILGNLMSRVGLNLDGDLSEQQMQICVNIESAKVEKFNYTVRFSRDTVPEMQRLLGQVQSQRGTSSDQGNVEGVDSESMRLANDLDIKYQMYQAQMAIYDAYIVAMVDKQNTLAKRGLKGQQTLIGSAISTAAMAGALQ